MRYRQWLAVSLFTALGACESATGPAVEDPEAWMTVREWQGNGDIVTEMFGIPASSWRIVWTQVDNNDVAQGQLYISVVSEAGAYITSASGKGPGTDTTYVHGSTGRHYLEIDALFADWTVRVERPE